MKQLGLGSQNRYLQEAMYSETRSILHKLDADRMLGNEVRRPRCIRQIQLEERPIPHLRCLTYQLETINREHPARIHSTEQAVEDNCRETIGMNLMRKLVTISNYNRRIHCLSPQDQDTTMERGTIRLKDKKHPTRLPRRPGLQEHHRTTETAISVAQVLSHHNLRHTLNNLNLRDRHEVCNCLTGQRDNE